ncbi:hypothetical protein GGS20DRAFT_537703 [Poronia punctata]|nr:hypothetical protein GGS20DRAFT_537703 [Poronia punctata]
MATPRIASSPTCLSCLRRLAQPSSPSVFASAATLTPAWAWTQTRTKASKAQLEDLQGIPVRLLHDIPGFGRKHAIIRVKRGRMRNIWFPKGKAEYMTRQRFTDMGLTEAAIGVRDRSFGVVNIEPEDTKAKLPMEEEQPKSLTLEPELARALIISLVPEVLVFTRSVVVKPSQPAPKVSPSLAPNAATSSSSEQKEAPTPEPVKAIFGSVTVDDILRVIKEKLLTDRKGAYVSIDASSITMLGLDRNIDGENRIKRLGTFEILISPGTVDGKPLPPVSRVVQVVAGKDKSAAEQ